MKGKRKTSVFILSAPSGAGKSTLIQQLLSGTPSLLFSVSHTTRPPRDGERPGVDYFFVTTAEFEGMIRESRFLEWAQVHGYYYGTSRSMLELAREQEKDLVLDIDVQGAAQVRRALQEAVSIFVLPPSFEDLKIRLLQRRKDSPEAMKERLKAARREIEHYHEYEYVVINEDLSDALADLQAIIRGERARTANLEERIEKILDSFII